MKAIIYHQYGKPGVLEELNIDKPQIADNRVLIEVYASGINPKDCLVRKGKFRLFTGNNFPKQVGYDFSGKVIDVGKGVESIKTGDPVYGMINGWKGTTYSEYLLARPDELCAKPDNLTLTEAAAVPLAAQTALQALRDIGKIKNGDHVCINGASGGVGTFATQIAKAFQSKITGICSDRNAEFVKQLGADEVINYQCENILEQNMRFDIFFDVFGNFQFKQVKKILNDNGVYISTIPSVKRVFKEIWYRMNPIGKKERLIVVKSKNEDLSFLKGMIEKKKIKPIIDQIFPIQQARDSHRYIEAKRVRGKIVLQIKEP